MYRRRQRPPPPDATYSLPMSTLGPQRRPGPEWRRIPLLLHKILVNYPTGLYWRISGKMVKFLKPGKVVIVLQGRHAGKKAVIVKSHDEASGSRRYGHALICGLSKEPRKVIKKQSIKKQNRRSSLKTFIKTVNYTHLMPTRYNLTDVDLKKVISAETTDNAEKKKEANKEAKSLLEDKFKTGKNRWFFTKLRF
eukprot:jgi/Ulvmu1/4896/UM020_0182.1